MPRTWQYNVAWRLRYSLGIFDPLMPVAAFDFDGTLSPYRGKGASQGLTLTFLTLLASSRNLVILSNRSTAKETGATPVMQYVAELDAMLEEKGIAARAFVYMACGDNRYRKPLTGMWERYLADSLTDGPMIRTGSFYCGDAAGRDDDFSDSDYQFVLNIRIVNCAKLLFATPEVFFGAESWNKRLPTPRHLRLWNNPDHEERLSECGALLRAPRTCIIMVGSPASGKSLAVQRMIAKRNDPVTTATIVVSNDIQGRRCDAEFFNTLTKGDNCIVDNTNRCDNVRMFYASAAQNVGYKVIFCYLSTPHDVCVHLNCARMQEGEKSVPKIALRYYWSHFVPITPEETARYNATLFHIPFSVWNNAPPAVTEMFYSN